jgi:hypothetical protein
MHSSGTAATIAAAGKNEAQRSGISIWACCARWSGNASCLVGLAGTIRRRAGSCTQAGCNVPLGQAHLILFQYSNIFPIYIKSSRLKNTKHDIVVAQNSPNLAC